MTPVAQKLILAASDGTVHTGVNLATTTDLTRITGLPSNVGSWNIEWGFDKFVAHCVDNPENLYYSYDGASWVKSSPNPLDVSSLQKAFGTAVRLFYVGGFWFATIRGGFLVSSDGISWVLIYLGVATDGAFITTDVAYRPETATWFITCTNGDILTCAQPNPAVKTAWLRKAGAIPTTVLSMAYGWDQTLLQNVFIAMVSGGIYRSLDGFNWTKGPGTQASTSNRVKFIRTNDPTSYSVWAYVGAGVGATPPMFGIATSPYGTGFNNSRPLTNPGLGRDIAWDDTSFGVVGYRTSGTTVYPILQTIPESLTGSFTGTAPGGSFPSSVPGVSVQSACVYLPEVAPTLVTPAQDAAITTPGPVLGATLARTTGTDFQTAQWQIDTVNTFDSPNLQTVNNPLIAGYSGAQTYALPPAQALTANGTYYIRARSITFDGPLSPWSAPQSFVATIPAVPAPTAPTATNLTDYWPTFGATQAAYAGSTSRLEFQFATDAAFTSVISSYLQPTSFYTAAAGPNPSPYKNPDTTFIFSAGTYYVRARQWSVFGVVSPWSTGLSFTTTPAAPVLSGTAYVSGTNPIGSKKITAPTGTVATAHPTVSWLAQISTGMTTYPRILHMQIQTASDSGFTTNLTATDGADTLVPVGANATGSVYILQRIVAGSVYARGVLSDSFGVLSTVFTDVANFSIAHPPASLPVSPINGSLVNYDTNGQLFSWQFSDPSPGDRPTAYEIVITKASDGTLVYDSGKVVSTSVSGLVIIPTAQKGVNLAWVVRSWDTDDNPGPYSKPRTVTFLDPPVLTITAPPANGTVTTGRPTISWTLGGTGAQRAGTLLLTDQTTNKVVFSARNAANIQSVTPPQNVLTNTHVYLLRIDIVTTFGQNATISETFTASYVPPPSPVYTLDATSYAELGYIDVNWGGTVPDAYFYTWTVWRRVSGTDTWNQLFVTTNPAIVDYQDWSAITGVYYEYMVSQDADRSGILLGSSVGNPNDPVIATSGGWWFIDPTNNANNFYLNVTADSFTDEYEESQFAIIGRGRAKDVGTHLGLTGTVNATIRPSYGQTAQQRFNALRAMRQQNKRILVRDPFGNFYNMVLGNVQLQHVAGTGSTEMYDVTVPLDEVII